jgi:hypothetical protein
VASLANVRTEVKFQYGGKEENVLLNPFGSFVNILVVKNYIKQDFK